MSKLKPLILIILPVIFGMTCSDKIQFASGVEMTVAFYNLDNLFDTINDPITHDEEFTPRGKYRWNTHKYTSKLERLSTVISMMTGKYAPDVLGVCELENKNVLEDLALKTDPEKRYSVLHYDSEDERGIDVAMIYNQQKFKLLQSQNFVVKLSGDSSDRSRSILWAKLKSIKTNDTLQFIVCHFPSRREGKDESEPKRLDAAKLVKQIMTEKCDPLTQNLILLGDFNDQPWDKSMSQVIGAMDPAKEKTARFQNLMFQFRGQDRGTYRFRGQWNLLDQIIISSALNDGKNPEYETSSVSIKSEDWMIQKGKYKGYPLRTFGGNNWLNGYSDHLPVYISIRLSGYEKEKN